MTIVTRNYVQDDIAAMCSIWNAVVREGVAFPQTEELTEEQAQEFFACQSVAAVTEREDSGEILGMYILHPNNTGRCGHIANASYAVKSTARSQHVGEKLVLHSLFQAAKLGFKILQFNAVVKTNVHARHLYERLGFVPLGVIPGGFKMDDEHYEDIVPYYHLL